MVKLSRTTRRSHEVPRPQYPSHLLPTVDQGQLQAAQQACASLQPTQSPEQQAQRQQAILAFAQCMRDQGLDFPNPQPTAAGQFSMRSLLGNLDRSDPKVQAALTACQ